MLARDVVLGEKACLGRRVTRHPPDLTRKEKELGLAGYGEKNSEA